jgi:hypothetical protein
VTLTVGSEARRKYAMELPITPPPTITTFELAGTRPDIAGLS